MVGPTLRDVFEQTVAKFPNKEALVDRRLKKSWTYGEWDKDVNILANAFSQSGVQKGDRVSTILYNTAQFAMTLFACMKIGAVFNPINFRLTGEEISYIIRDCKPKIVLFEKETSQSVTVVAKECPEVQFWAIDHCHVPFAKNYDEQIANAPKQRPTCELHEDDTYAVMYTSGTTGAPKGVIHSHRNILDHSLTMAAVMSLTKEDRGVSVAPMFHCAELHCAFLPRLHMGGTNVLMHHFDEKELIQTIQEEKITTLFAAPTMWSMLLRQDLSKLNLSTLKSGLYGAAPMAPSLAKQLNDQMKIQLFQAYGMTEMGPAITICILINK